MPAEQVERHIYRTTGPFLIAACMEGNSSLSLEDGITAYRKKGNYNLNFSDIGVSFRSECIVGTFREPAIGSIRISHTPKDNPQYEILGDSYGQGIVAVILDCANIFELVTSETGSAEDLLRDNEEYIQILEGLLLNQSRVEEKRKEIFFEALEKLREKLKR